MGSSEKMTKSSGKDHPPMLYVIFCSLLIDLLAFTVILPLMPALMDYYQKSDPPDGLYSYCVTLIKEFQLNVGAPDRFNSVLFGGFLGSMFSFLQFIVSPLVGGLSDTYGRKPVLIVCLTGIIISYALWAISFNFSIFVFARILGGLSKGNVSLSMAIITDVSTTSSRAAGMALVGIAFSVGFVLGPLIGALFAKWASTNSDSHWFILPALFALVLSVIDLVFVIIFFKETLPKVFHKKPKSGKTKILEVIYISSFSDLCRLRRIILNEKRAKSVAVSISNALTYIDILSLFKFSAVEKLSDTARSSLSRLGIIYFVYLFLYSGLEFTLTFLTHHYFNYTPMKQGAMFFCIGLIMALLQGSYVRRIPTNKVKLAAFFGLLLIVPSYVAVGAASTEILLYFGLFLYAVSTAFVVPCLTTLASQFGDDDKKGTVLGVFRSLGALARALGPIFASIAFWSFGASITYFVGAAALVWPCYAIKTTKFKHE